jgi:NOL1/NOP2/sun family putative RNA methylase
LSGKNSALKKGRAGTRPVPTTGKDSAQAGMSVPPLFLEQMQQLLGDEYTAFQSIYTQSIATSGLRANTLKIDLAELQKRLPYSLSPLPWASEGFQIVPVPISTALPPGKHPYHAAGLYYLQEPSAMAVAHAVNPQPGERVLDLCAAPGGKTTHLAALMKGRGLLVANETHSRRVWELAENLERCGVTNCVVINETSAHLAAQWSAIFDRVLVDAPCSGEGMFRKSEAARRDWSPALVQSCAIRQSAILNDAARLVRPGGRLVYSTCTFNPLENEQNIVAFLSRHADFSLAEVPATPGLFPGRTSWVRDAIAELVTDLCHAVRLWPHLPVGDTDEDRLPYGEGHFVAVLQRSPDIPEGMPLSVGASAVHTPDGRSSTPENDATSASRTSSSHGRDKTSSWDKASSMLLHEARRTLQYFCQATLAEDIFFAAPSGDLFLSGSYLYHLPSDLPDLDGLHVIHPGWWLGTFHTASQSGRARFEPSHALALGLHASQVKRRLDLSLEDPRLAVYLRGETLDLAPSQSIPSVPGEQNARYEADGWTLVTIDGFPLGWGKAVQGRLKNAYPRGLRQF